jgi:hypothetical protein
MLIAGVAINAMRPMITVMTINSTRAKPLILFRDGKSPVRIEPLFLLIHLD